METMLETQNSQLQLIDARANKNHNSIIQAINSFTEIVKSRVLFLALSEILTEADLSLKSAALNGCDGIENAVLAALCFHGIDIQEAQFQEACKDTCSWIFEI